MTAKDAIKRVFDSNFAILEKYVSDLSDADLLVRPVPGANHVAWQLGHLIASEISLLSSISGGAPLELPPGFAERHGKETASVEPPKGFLTKAEYLSIFKKVRAQTFAKLDKLLNDFHKLNEKRKRVAHGLWMPFMHGGAVSYTPRTNLTPSQFTDQASELEKLADNACELRAKLDRTIYELPEGFPRRKR